MKKRIVGSDVDSVGCDNCKDSSSCACFARLASKRKGETAREGEKRRQRKRISHIALFR